ncbi:hypothetical protein Tco_0289593, partial [Tanacetum coccineum]
EVLSGSYNWKHITARHIMVSPEESSSTGQPLEQKSLGMTYKRSKSENKGKVPTEMELGLEFTQQGSSHEVSDTYPILLSFTHCGNKSILRVLRIILVILPEHPSETMVFHNEDGNPARANIKQALGYLKDGDGDGNSQPHKGVKASANSDVMYSFTSAQDGNPLQDDVRLCLGDVLKKAQDHCQRQAWNDIEKMTLDEYVEYKAEKERRFWKSIRSKGSPKRDEVLVYSDSDEEDEEYYRLSHVLPYFQTPQPCTRFNFITHSSSEKVDIDNMTIEEYERYELAMSWRKSGI